MVRAAISTALVPRLCACANTPSSLAFGRGDGFDPCSVYVTQLFGSRILRVALGAEGAPLLPFD